MNQVNSISEDNIERACESVRGLRDPASLSDEERVIYDSILETWSSLDRVVKALEGDLDPASLSEKEFRYFQRKLKKILTSHHNGAGIERIREALAGRFDPGLLTAEEAVYYNDGLAIVLGTPSAEEEVFWAELRARRKQHTG